MSLNLGHFPRVTKTAAIEAAINQIVKIVFVNYHIDPLDVEYRMMDSDNVAYLVYPSGHYRFKWCCCPISDHGWLNNVDVKDGSKCVIIHCNAIDKRIKFIEDKEIIMRDYVSKYKKCVS